MSTDTDTSPQAPAKKSAGSAAPRGTTRTVASANPKGRAGTSSRSTDLPRPVAKKAGWKDLDVRAVDTGRLLAADAVQLCGSGHPGTAMSLSPVAYLLYQQVLAEAWERTPEHGTSILMLSPHLLIASGCLCLKELLR